MSNRSSDCGTTARTFRTSKPALLEQVDDALAHERSQHLRHVL